MSAEGRTVVNLDDLGIEQLSSLQKQIETEIEFFTESLKQLKIAANKYLGSAKAVEDLGKSKDGDTALIPLSESMYVRAELSEPNKTMVDIGTGYYVELSNEKAIDFFNRKNKYIMTQVEKIEQLIREKSITRQKVVDRFQAKVRSALATQPAQ